MEREEFVEKFDKALKESGKVYVDFKDGFFVADGYTSTFYGDIILELNDKIIGRIDLLKVKRVKEL